MTLTRKGPGWGPAMSSGRSAGRKGGRQRRLMKTVGRKERGTTERRRKSEEEEKRKDIRKGKGRKEVLSAPSHRKSQARKCNFTNFITDK